MTANQMRLYFKDLYDGASDVEMGFDDSEVSRFLTMAQDLELERRFFPNRNAFAEGYEVGAKRDNEFSELKTHVYIYNDSVNHISKIVLANGSVVNEVEWEEGIFPNSIIITLPSDFMYFSADLMDIYHNNVRHNAVQVKAVNENELAELRINTFIKPDKRTLYRYTYPRSSFGNNPLGRARTSRRCMILTDEFTTLRRYYLSYIRQPQDIVVDILQPLNQRNCELNEEFHLAIVRRAVELALGSIGSEKYQISLTEKSLNE